MTTSPIIVTGGRFGLGARLDELDAAAALLAREAAALAEESARLLALAVHPALLGAEAAATVAAVEHGALGDLARIVGLVADVEQGLVRVAGPGGGIAESGSLLALAGAVGGAVAAYRAAEAGASAAVRTGQAQVDLAVGAALPVLTAVALLAPDGRSGASDWLDEAVREQPWLVDAAVGGADELLRSVTTGGAGLALATTWVVAGRPWPADAEGALALARALAARGGYLGESGRPPDVALEPARTVTAPRGVADLARDEVDLGRDDDPGRLAVVHVRHADGSSAWVVELPGTQTWAPMAGDNPFDATTDVLAMLRLHGDVTAAAGTALDEAMRRAGRQGADDPVLLVGHSQGGIIAAQLAADPEFTRTHNVTHVVTMGSPVARMPLPSGIRVLSLEHDVDPVPRLDGRPNPDTASWTTVTRDVADLVPAATAAHDCRLYTATAELVDRSAAAGTDPSLADWAASAAPFLGAGAGAEVTAVHVRRSGKQAPAY